MRVVILSKNKCPKCGSKRVSVYTGQGRSWCRACRNNFYWEIDKQEILEDIREKFESDWREGWTANKLTREQYKDGGLYTFSVIQDYFENFGEAKQTAIESLSEKSAEDGEK